MGDIDLTISNERTYTQSQMEAIIRDVVKQMDIEREDKINGVEIPRQVSEELDNTPTHQLNENFKKFRRETQRYVMGERTTPEKINKSVAPYLKKHSTETAMVVNTI
ncbi:hypothetical protein CU098_008172 [Rhizopus stolonifer]|uniref:Uncharacterized protein n=1 Tax=Rhizopus stolonifer TaxID=4846 RepID=A0A367IR85_RHIST|nr:hypothetical protein CU098_008172 [Rhizopus stolonifer]